MLHSVQSWLIRLRLRVLLLLLLVLDTTSSTLLNSASYLVNKSIMKASQLKSFDFWTAQRASQLVRREEESKRLKMWHLLFLAELQRVCWRLAPQKKSQVADSSTDSSL